MSPLWNQSNALENFTYKMSLLLHNIPSEIVYWIKFNQNNVVLEKYAAFLISFGSNYLPLSRYCRGKNILLISEDFLCFF